MPNPVPFNDLSRIHKPLQEDILARISSVISRSAFVLGAEVKEFEAAFAQFIGTSHGVGVNSGLDALKIALEAGGVGPGDEVILPANTFIATAFAVSAVGATPVLVDAEERSYNIDPNLVERAITRKTKAIIPVHLYGQPAAMGPIMEIAAKHRLLVIEDAAQSHGAEYNGKKAGSFGVAGCFSFYPGKNLGAMGEAGMITTSDEEIARRARVLRDVGQKQKYHHELIGQNSRLHTMQAAVLLAKLPHLVAYNEERRQIAQKFCKGLAEVEGILLPPTMADRTHVFHLFIVQTKNSQDRDKLRKHLQDRQIDTGIHYPVPLHLQPCYSKLGLQKGAFPITERLADSIVTLPVFPGMTGGEVDAVISGVREFFRC